MWCRGHTAGHNACRHKKYREFRFHHTAPHWIHSTGSNAHARDDFLFRDGEHEYILPLSEKSHGEDLKVVSKDTNHVAKKKNKKNVILRIYLFGKISLSSIQGRVLMKPPKNEMIHSSVMGIIGVESE